MTEDITTITGHAPADPQRPSLAKVMNAALAPYNASAASFCHSGSYRVTQYQPVQRCHSRSMGPITGA
jgi:hypothetical protein